MERFPRPAEQDRAADFVALGGTVRTMDAAGTVAGGLAARDGRIVAVGSDRDVAALIGADTTVLDLDGRTALPGFVESHNHPAFFGLTLAAPVDAGSPPNDTISDIVDRVAQAVADRGPGEWIRGYRYDDTLLADNRHPTLADLDPVSRHSPVVLTHVSGHFCVANSVALRTVGITAATPDPPGGHIARDEHGEPTGLLVETAAFLVTSRLPGQGVDELTEALLLADQEYLANGVTSVHDTGVGLIGGATELEAYQALLRAGKLRTRTRGYLIDRLVPGLADGRPEPPDLAKASERFTMAGVKIIADGSIQGRTGCLAEGYACAPDEHGMMLLDPAELGSRIASLDAAGWQVAVHGNGDAAIEAIIDGYAKLGSPAGTGRRHRIEHCQTAREDQLDRMAAHDVLASFFIKHVYYWGDRHRDVFLGNDRARRISPLASARSRGIHFGLHSDTPVTPVPPLEGIWCAVRRRTRDGEVLGPEQAVSVDAALRGYTIDAAYLAGEENLKGSLEIGKLADLVVLSEDPASGDPDRIRDLSVEVTVSGGEIAWDRATVRSAR
ncbi:N-substituted formamide deformylase [Amycolatopsis sp. CA-230715]|nr:N-substituted formamide deformylase [Amycolatopsis sp. CA-230715]